MTFIVSKKHYSDRLLGITPSNVAVAAGPHSPETATVEQILEEGRPWTGLGGTHIVLRGVVTAESIRCHWIGRAFPPLDTSDLWTFITGKETAEEMPAREEIEEILRPLTSPTGEGPVTREGALINHLLEGGYSEDLLQLMCYADYHVNEYLMGTGPEKVTVAYNSIYTEVGWEVLKKASAMAVYTDEKPLDREQYEQELLRPREEILRTHLTHALSNRETIVFLHPAAAIGNLAVETWSGLAHWDVQEDPTGQLLAVRYGTSRWDSEHSQTLDELKERITSAAATDALAGKRLASIEDITDHYQRLGAYGDITPYDNSDDTFTPAQPRAPYAPGEKEPVPTPTPTIEPTRAPAPTPTRTLTPPTMAPPTAMPPGIRPTATPRPTLPPPTPDPGAYRDWNPSCENSRAVPAVLNSPGLTGDCTTLLTAKPTLDPNNQLNWHRELSITEWYGIEITGTPERVTSIELNVYPLHGQIPGELGNLTELQFLRLRDLSLTGQIPQEISLLQNLIFMELSYNALTSAIPASLGYMENLSSVTLNNNQLTGNIPPELGRLNLLQFLNVANNNLTGTVPQELTSITMLQRLYLENNNITGCVPPRPDDPYYNVFGVPICSAGQ